MTEQPADDDATTVDDIVVDEPEQDTTDVPPEEPGTEPEPDTFPRSYVEELREESKRYRQRAQRADTYAQRLHTELVRATGRLADPTDIPFDETHIDEPDTLTAAIEDLLTRKPHLASRRPTGDIGQGVSGSVSSVDLAAMLRQRAQ